MHKILFEVGGITVYSYGVFLALAFIVATIVARARFRELYKDPDIVLDFVLAAVVGGIIGARVFYVIGHWSDFSAHPADVFKFNMAGLVFYGGLVLGLALTLLVGWWKKVRFWATLDLAGLCLPLALGIGRIGCLLNGCCYGRPTTMFWGIHYPVSLGLAGARHPTQIYELLLDFTLFGLLWWKRDAMARDGAIFWAFVTGYGAIRFFVEFFREHTQSGAGLGFQAASLAMVVVGGLVLLFRYRILPSRGTERL